MKIVIASDHGGFYAKSEVIKFLTAEKFEFIGFLTSKLVLRERKIYHIGFSPDFSKLNIDLDFLYLLNSAIYQKLNEIKV